MDIVRFKGGLGNQMFQYALVKALQKKGREVCCDLGFYKQHPDLMPFVLDKVFVNLDLNVVSDEIFESIDIRWQKIRNDEDKKRTFEKDLENRFFFLEADARTYQPEVFATKECAFVGYWQTEKYLKNIREDIIREYKFNIKEQKLITVGNRLKENYIGVHIRRGDYLTVPAFQVCGLDYYWNAIQIMKEKVPNAKFIFFSDDKQWVKEVFQMDMEICMPEMFDSYKDWYDMYLMTKCRGNIIANSSFSWWGAWLNQIPDRVIIAPSVWSKGKETPDIWCDEWIKIKP